MNRNDVILNDKLWNCNNLSWISKTCDCNSEDNIKSPVHWVVQFLVHDHGLKHGSLTHDKFNHTVYEAQEVPVGITVVTTTTNNMWKLVTITVKSNMVRWTSSPQSWLKKVSFFLYGTECILHVELIKYG